MRAADSAAPTTVSPVSATTVTMWTDTVSGDCGAAALAVAASSSAEAPTSSFSRVEQRRRQ